MGFAGLGDTLLSTPAVRLLRERSLGSKFVALTVSNDSRSVLSCDPDMSEVVYAQDMWSNPILFFKTVLWLRRRHFDLSITLYPSSRILYNVLSFFSGAPVRVVHDYPGDYFRKLSFLQNRRVPLVEGGHSVVQNMKLVEAVGVDVSGADVGLVFQVPEESRRRASDFFSSVKKRPEDVFVGVHPGSGGMAYKRWPLERFVELSERLESEFSWRTVFFCGPNEQDVAESLRRRSKLVFEGSLADTAAVIGGCSLFVSNDSGLMHVAVSQNVPVVGIFGPTDPKKTGPYTENKVNVVSTLECSPCYDPAAHRKFRCKWGDIRCLKAVSVDEVFSEIRDFMKRLRDGR